MITMFVQNNNNNNSNNNGVIKGLSADWHL